MINVIEFKPPDCEKLVMFSLVSTFDGVEFSHSIESSLMDETNSDHVKIIINHLRSISDEMEEENNHLKKLVDILKEGDTE